MEIALESGRTAWLKQLPFGLSQTELRAEAKRRLLAMLEATVRGTPIDRFSLVTEHGDLLVAKFVLHFLAISIRYLADTGTYEGPGPIAILDGHRHRFTYSVDPYRADTIEYHLLRTDMGTLRRPQSRGVVLEFVPQFRKARLFIPKQLNDFRDNDALELIKILFEAGYAWLKRHFNQITFEFGSNLASSLYNHVRTELGGFDKDEHWMFATLPRGRGGQIIYLVDDHKIDQLLRRVGPHARELGESSFAMVSEFIRNNVEYSRIHARHAIERDQGTEFNLQTSMYRDDHDLFNETEKAWYGSEAITILPFLNTESEILMAVSGADHRDRISKDLKRLGAGLKERFHRNRDEAIQQLDLLNTLSRPNVPFKGEYLGAKENPAVGIERSPSAFREAEVLIDQDQSPQWRGVRALEIRRREQDMITILFVAANPSDATRLALDKEYREIEARLRAARHRDRFTLEIAPAMTPKNLSNAILRFKPTIVHFSGHGSSEGQIILMNDRDEAVAVPSAALTELFRIWSDTVRCVVLNACFSESQATALAKHIDCVVGMSDAIADDAAIAFAEAFYDVIAGGEHLRRAFDLARNSIALQTGESGELPQLLTKTGVVPEAYDFLSPAGR